MIMYKKPRKKLFKTISSALILILLLTCTGVYGEVSTLPSTSETNIKINIPQPEIFYAQKSKPLDYWMTLFTEENPKGWNDPTFYDAAFDNKSGFVAVGDYYEKAATYSKNGRDWKTVGTEFTECRDIAYGNGIYVAVDGRIFTSKDGVEWNKIDGLNIVFSYIEFGNGRFFAIGKREAGYEDIYVGAVSTDGINWTTAPIAGKANRFVDGVHFVNDSFWIVKDDFVIATTDGTSSYMVYCPAVDHNSIQKALYGNGTYLVYLAGDIYTSKDCSDWQMGKSMYDLVDITFAKDMFVALCRGEDYKSKIYTSKDGANWTLEAEIGYEHFTKMLFARDRFYLFGYPNKVMCSAPIIPPMDPELIQASVSNGKVKLMWNSPNDTSAIFGVFRSTSPDSGFSMVGIVDNGIYYTEEAPEQGTYYYKVIAGNMYGDSDFSNVMSVKIGGLLAIRPVLLSFPSVPTELEGDAESPYEISLSWKDNSTNESGFKILRRLEAGDYKVVGFTEGDETSYTDKGLVQDTTYEYKICAFNIMGDSSDSNEISITTEKRMGALESMSVDMIKELVSKWEADEPAPTPTPEVTPTPTPAPASTTAPDSVTSASQVKVVLTIGSGSYTVDGTPAKMDAEPLIKDDRTLVPFRYIAQAIGAVVAWDSKEQKVTVTLNKDVVELWIGKNTARVNGKSVQIDAKNTNVTPVIVPPGRTMTPLRFIAESLGCEVKYDSATKSIEVIYVK